MSDLNCITANDLTKLLESLSISSERQITDYVADFTLPEEKLHIFTGLYWNQIIELREMMTSLRDSANRTVTQALVVFLLKLRSGNSNEMIAAILGLENAQQVSKFSDSILNSFEVDVLPTRFGLQAMNRDNLIKITRLLR